MTINVRKICFLLKSTVLYESYWRLSVNSFEFYLSCKYLMQDDMWEQNSLIFEILKTKNLEHKYEIKRRRLTITPPHVSLLHPGPRDWLLPPASSSSPTTAVGSGVSTGREAIRTRGGGVGWPLSQHLIHEVKPVPAAMVGFPTQPPLLSLGICNSKAVEIIHVSRVCIYLHG